MKYRFLLMLIFTCFLIIVNSIVGWCGDTNDQTRIFTIDSWGNGSSELQIVLPSNFEYSKHKGPDFDVHYFSDSTTDETLAIYIGHNPNMDKNDMKKATKQHVGNIRTTFYSKNIDDQVSYQSIVKGFFKGQNGSGVSKLLMHIMITGNSDNFTQTIFKYLKTLKIKNKG